MPFCVKCGKELNYSDKFCSVCGKENEEYRTESGPKTGEYDITVTSPIRLFGPQDADTEIELYIPQLGRSMHLRFPNFFELGQTLRVRGEGLTKPNSEKGDLLVTPSEVEYYDTELTISARLVGAADDITKVPLYLPHAGKTVQVSVPNDIKAGKTLRLKGLGLDTPHGEKGDLYLHFNHIDYVPETAMPPHHEKAEDSPKRKQEYVGRIKKCPACGEEIPALTAICPACGHELNSTKVTSSLASFIAALDECDSRIAQEPKVATAKKGFKTWDKKLKIGWIILNFLTSFIPLAIYIALPHIKPLFGHRAPALTTEEKKKADLIENYAFPNEREAILEALLFIKTKIAFLASEKYSAKTAYWMNLWNTKADQVQEKAKLVLNNDSIAEAAHSEVIQCKQKVQKKVRIRAAVAASAVVVLAVFVVINGSLYRGISNILTKAGIIENSMLFEWYDTGLSTKLPEVKADRGDYSINTEDRLNVSVFGYSSSDFEKYVTACKEKGFTVNAEKDTNTYRAYNLDGDYLYVYLSGRTMHIELKTVVTGDVNFNWPDGGLADMVPEFEASSGELVRNNEKYFRVITYGVSDAEFNKYVKLCKNSGYDIDCISSAWSFSGYNEEGYELSVSLDKVKAMVISLTAPAKTQKIDWDTYPLAKNIPEPKFTEGTIEYNTSSFLSVALVNVSEDAFNEYVDKCIRKGYDVDYRRSEDYFRAENKKGYTITINYERNNIMSISVKAPED